MTKHGRYSTQGMTKTLHFSGSVSVFTLVFAHRPSLLYLCSGRIISYARRLFNLSVESLIRFKDIGEQIQTKRRKAVHFNSGGIKAVTNLRERNGSWCLGVKIE